MLEGASSRLTAYVSLMVTLMEVLAWIGAGWHGLAVWMCGWYGRCHEVVQWWRTGQVEKWCFRNHGQN